MQFHFCHYIQEKQVFNFFEIEHYFSQTFLEDSNMIKEIDLKKGIFEISKGKNKFADKIIQIREKSIFEDFVYLFNEIDRLTGEKINYGF